MSSGSGTFSVGANGRFAEKRTIRRLTVDAGRHLRAQGGLLRRGACGLAPEFVGPFEGADCPAASIAAEERR
jgi:hypothetical protein